MKIKTIIVDDERLARKELKNLLKIHNEIEIIAEASNALEAKDLIEKLKPQLIFLDIQMPQKSGFDLLNELEIMPKVVFTTAFDQFAIKAFEINAFDYLLKPIVPERLSAVIAKLTLFFQKNEFSTVDNNTFLLNEDSQVFLKDGERCWFVKLGEIRVFESIGNYSKVYFQKFNPLILKSLNYLEERIDPKLFFRVNRKYLINLKLIKKIDVNLNAGFIVEMQDGFTTDISRRQAVRFKDLMSL